MSIEISELDPRTVLTYYNIPFKEGSNIPCPLPGHHETHGASFSLFETADGKKLWKCFGKCDESGNAVKLIMRLEEVDFLQALHIAEKIYGVKLVNSAASEKNKSLYKINGDMARIYHEELLKTPVILDYLKKQRGLTAESIEYFGLGWALKSHVLNDQPEMYEEFVKAGVMSLLDGKYVPVFNRRIVAPVKDFRGGTEDDDPFENIIAFTGRLDPFATGELKEKAPKYKNSPATEIFEKRKAAFGYGSKFRELVKKHGFVALGEGAFDAMVMQQEGIPMLALLGLGANDTEIFQTLMRFSQTLIFCFDGDEAGYKRAFTLCVNTLFPFIDANPKVKFKIAFLPEGYDPDEYVLKYGTAAALEVMNKALSPENYVATKIIYEGSQIEDFADRRAWLFENHEKSIRNFPAITRQAYFKRMSEKLELDITNYFNSLAQKTPDQPKYQHQHSFPARNGTKKPTNNNPASNTAANAQSDNPAQVNAENGADEKPVYTDEKVIRYYRANFPKLLAIKRSPEILAVINTLIEQAGLYPMTPVVVDTRAFPNIEEQSKINPAKFWSKLQNRIDFLNQYRSLVAKKYFMNDSHDGQKEQEIKDRLATLRTLVANMQFETEIDG